MKSDVEQIREWMDSLNEGTDPYTVTIKMVEDSVTNLMNVQDFLKAYLRKGHKIHKPIANIETAIKLIESLPKVIKTLK